MAIKQALESEHTQIQADPLYLQRFNSQNLCGYLKRQIMIHLVKDTFNCLEARGAALEDVLNTGEVFEHHLQFCVEFCIKHLKLYKCLQRHMPYLSKGLKSNFVLKENWK